MPAYYRARLNDFLRASDSEIEAILADQNARASFPLEPEALFAWQFQLPELRSAMQSLVVRLPDAQSWSLLLEYPIPRVGKRIDAVLLARNIIVVIEFKTGDAPNSAARQVDDYALSLACFHEGSSSRTVVPLVVSNAAVMRRTEKTRFDHLIQSCIVSSFAAMDTTIEQIVTRHCNTGIQIDPTVWDEARFKPIPPIIDAAVALYSNMNVFEIGHSCAAREDLETATKAIVSEVLGAQQNGRKTVCFVTGVPGAGKTLVGLNAVHEPAVRKVGSFLSGNGPLVKIIREALIRDVVRRKKEARADAALLVHTFVQNVHKFADGFHKTAQIPNEHVIVFDEAQRAWDLAESQRAGRELSEPEMILQIMDRHTDWAVIVALVGGGQEINRGEAGLSEWGRALNRFSHWRVVASPEVLPQSTPSAAFTLFDEPDTIRNHVVDDNSLHLKVAVRSIRAQKISDWVNALLAGEYKVAVNIAAGMADTPKLTRSLATARAWLTEKRRGFTRAGLVGAASASRLRADGLEPSFDFHRRFEWENWFLDGDEDVRCSSRLEVVATQFEIQGLELDFVGVCWGDDFIWDGAQWVCNRFNNKRWKPLRIDTPAGAKKNQFRINAYRVLLTRARQGMIIYVPRPPTDDPSRMGDELERTAAFILSCGAVEVC